MPKEVASLTKSVEPAHLASAFQAITSLSDGILSVDEENRVTYLNPAGELLTGWSLQQALGKNAGEVLKVVNALTRQVIWHPIQAVMQDDDRYGMLPNSVLLRRDGFEVPIEDSVSPIHDEYEKVVGAVVCFRDVGLSRLMLMKAIHRANHDVLTTLPNRAYLDIRISQALTMLQNAHVLGILFIDVDRFKSINDIHGHATGDYVLQVVAKRIADCLRTSDTVCRAGGDEFIVLLPEVATSEAVGRIAEKVLQCAQAPMVVEGNLIHITLSMGIAVSQVSDGSDAASLVEHADQAMYAAKRSGGSQAHWFSPSMVQLPLDRTRREDQLSLAVEEQRFLLHYQPQIDLRTGKILGVEALVRWDSKESGLLYPQSFLPALERLGLIVEVGQFVLREALRQLNVWRGQGFRHLVMAVNVSSVELYQKGYFRALDKILHDEGYAPGSLMLELTESVLLQFEHDVESLEELKRRGIQLGMDDFGTGYSSLNYLRRFPVDILKIDRNFVANIATNEQDAALVKAILHMAKNMKKIVIAEGIETDEQATMLREFGCEQAQGFLFNKPLTAEAMSCLLRKERILPTMGELPVA